MSKRETLKLLNNMRGTYNHLEYERERLAKAQSEVSILSKLLDEEKCKLDEYLGNYWNMEYGNLGTLATIDKYIEAISKDVPEIHLKSKYSWEDKTGSFVEGEG